MNLYNKEEKKVRFETHSFSHTFIGVIAISLDKHAENEAIRKTMLQELDKSKDEAKELQTKVNND